MDPGPMYPKGFHPKNVTTDITGYRKAHPKRRRDVLSSVRYYFIDFGISSMFGPDDTDKTVLGLEGQDNSVPELSERRPYDPFLVDIYIIGNLLRTAFLEVCDTTTLARWHTDLFRNTIIWHSYPLSSWK